MSKVIFKASKYLSDDEINAEYESIAKAYGMDADKVKEMVAIDSIAADMKVKKAMDLVKSAAIPASSNN